MAHLCRENMRYKFANQHLPTEKLCSINYNIDQRAQWHVHCELATLSFHFILYVQIDCHRVTYCCIILNSHHTGIYSQALHKLWPQCHQLYATHQCSSTCTTAHHQLPYIHWCACMCVCVCVHTQVMVWCTSMWKSLAKIPHFRALPCWAGLQWTQEEADNSQCATWSGNNPIPNPFWNYPPNDM